MVHPLPSGEAAAANGKYSFKVVQPGGQSFTGRAIRFRVGVNGTGQRAAWIHGEAFGLVLTLGIGHSVARATQTAVNWRLESLWILPKTGMLEAGF